MSRVAHVCHAPGCRRPTRPKMLMCPWCWDLVSPEHQAAVWEHYRPGQERDKRPSKPWLAAAMDAKADVLDAREPGAGDLYRASAERLRVELEAACRT